MCKELKVMVSVICVTYNHSKYIRKALNSFIAQKTDFPFEILVHDDASTDGTDLIVREYEEQYPGLIKAFYETENQYSKGTPIVRTILLPKAEGKYMAMCEGDDYWTDEKKLQKQVQYMESHPNCSFCVHGAEIVSESGGHLGYIAPFNSNQLVSCDEVLQRGGAFVATNSFFAPMALAKNTPDYFDICGMDWVWQMYLSSMGSTYYLKDVMSAYRRGGVTSWSVRTGKDRSIVAKQLPKYIKARERFDELTDYQHHEVISFLIGKCKFEIAVYNKDRKLLMDTDVQNALERMSKKEYNSIKLRYTFPRMFFFLDNTKMKIKQIINRANGNQASIEGVE